MDPKRLRDAHRLLDKLPADEWVETYARDVLEMAFKRDEENAREGFERLSKVSLSGAKLHRGVHGAVLAFQKSIGGGDAKRGEESLGAGNLKPTKARWARAVVFYQQIRLALATYSAEAKERLEKSGHLKAETTTGSGKPPDLKIPGRLSYPRDTVEEVMLSIRDRRFPDAEVRQLRRVYGKMNRKELRWSP